MLKSNSKKALENIRSYIRENYDPAGYENAPEETAPFHDIAIFLWDTFQKEKQYSIPYMNRNSLSYQSVFASWCAGLPSVLDTCYYYNRSAITDVKNIMEETDKETEKYTEQEAENFLSYLIYKVIRKEVK